MRQIKALPFPWFIFLVSLIAARPASAEIEIRLNGIPTSWLLKEGYNTVSLQKSVEESLLENYPELRAFNVDRLGKIFWVDFRIKKHKERVYSRIDDRTREVYHLSVVPVLQFVHSPGSVLSSAFVWSEVKKVGTSQSQTYELIDPDVRPITSAANRDQLISEVESFAGTRLKEKNQFLATLRMERSFDPHRILIDSLFVLLEKAAEMSIRFNERCDFSSLEKMISHHREVRLWLNARQIVGAKDRPDVAQENKAEVEKYISDIEQRLESELKDRRADVEGLERKLTSLMNNSMSSARPSVSPKKRGSKPLQSTRKP